MQGGDTSSSVLSSQGKLYSCGMTQFDPAEQLVSNMFIPVYHDQLPPLIQVTSGNFFQLVLDQSNQVWGFGLNIYGLLTTEKSRALFPLKENEDDPQAVTGLPPFIIPFDVPIISIATNDTDVCFAIDADNRLWSWGKNYLAREPENKFTPGLTSLTNVHSVQPSSKTCIALDRDGYVWEWTKKSDPCKNGLDNITAISSCGRSSIALTRSQQVYRWGEKWETPELLEGLESIQQIASGKRHWLFLNTTGEVFALGENIFGQCGIETNKIGISSPLQIPLGFPVTKICCGNYHSMIVDANHDLWTFGLNQHLQLGTHNSDNQHEPFKVPLDFSLFSMKISSVKSAKTS